MPRTKGYVARNVTIKVSSNLHIICLWVPSMCGENMKTNCGSSSDKSRINEYTWHKNGRTYEWLCFWHQQLCPGKKGYFARNVTINVSRNLHSICFQFPSMCVVNLRMNCGSSSDENSINEYTSNKNGGTYGRLCRCISSRGQKKRLVCSKRDNQSFLQFAHHLPLGSVNVW